MLCPFCREKDTSVVDSRPTEDGTAIRRRRVCLCGGGQRFTTFERVQFRELTVLKSVIGKIVMENLKELDKIAYIRFASVYTNFKEVKEFEEYIEKLDGKK